MQNLVQFLAAFDALQSAGERIALVSIVGVTGSARRKPGTRALVTAGGQWAGAVSGGCLESDIGELVSDVLATGVPVRRRYDTRHVADIFWGFGSGCSGTVDVLVEVVGQRQGILFDYLRRCIEQRAEGMLVTQTRSDTDARVSLGRRWTRLADGTFMSPAGQRLPEAVLGACRTMSPGLDYLPFRYRGEAFLIERVRPPVKLLTLGAGPDAQALRSLAGRVGWCIDIVDELPDRARTERLPAVVDAVASPATRLWDGVDVDGRTAIVMLTHNYLLDRYVLCKALATVAAYVGVLGSRDRAKRMLEDIAAAGYVFSAASMSRLFSPVGLDIGAQTPEELAVSVVAEIQARFCARVQPGSLGQHAAALPACVASAV